MIGIEPTPITCSTIELHRYLIVILGENYTQHPLLLVQEQLALAESNCYKTTICANLYNEKKSRKILIFGFLHPISSQGIEP